MISRRDDLVAIIASDLINYGKLPILMLILVVASAVAVIGMTSETRIVVDHREQLIHEESRLNVEWRNLILEEEVWGKQNRILQIAQDKLNMGFVDVDKEYVVLEKQE